MAMRPSEVIALEMPPSRHAAPFRLAVIGNWPPRRCGIATFTADMVQSLRRAAPSAEIRVHAMIRDPEDRANQAELAGQILESDRPDYREAGLAIEASAVDAVWVQHEFGIFGGEAGEYVLDLLAPIAAPLIVTLHTVLDQPSPAQERVIAWFAAHAARLVVMSRHAARILLRRGDVDAERVVLIEHGAPDRTLVETAVAKQELGFPAGPLLLTFGLLSPGKGIEAAIEALAQVTADHPDTIYVIAGATHPNLIAREGEAYRERLRALAERLGVAGSIRWIDRYLETEQLLDLIAAADIYITPYTSAAQATSGTLSYAVAMGKAVVSTPYIHAAELLADGHGVLTAFNDPAGLATAIAQLLAQPELLHQYQRRAYRRGRGMIWSRFAYKSLQVIEAVRAGADRRVGTPALLGDHDLERLCDDTGIYQHSVLAVPDRAHGYCIDDNARALILGNLSGGAFGARTGTFAAFIQHAWNPEVQRFRNFMGFDRRWLESAGSDDSCGRALWALGATAATGSTSDLRHWAIRLWWKSAAIALEFPALRSIAFAVLGADQILETAPDDPAAWAIIDAGAARLGRALARHSHDGWTWFEPFLSYDNCRLAEAMLLTARRRGDRPAADRALAALRWVAEVQTANSGCFRPVGTESFGSGLLPPLPFDQQPVDAWATIDAAALAFRHSGDRHWRGVAERAYGWFFGANDRSTPLADRRDGSCRDGLTPRGVNANRGAESVLALHLAAHGLAAIQSGGRPREPGQLQAPKSLAAG